MSRNHHYLEEAGSIHDHREHEHWENRGTRESQDTQRCDTLPLPPLHCLAVTEKRVFEYHFPDRDTRSVDGYHRGLFRFVIRHLVEAHNKEARVKREPQVSEQQVLAVMSHNPVVEMVLTVLNEVRATIPVSFTPVMAPPPLCGGL